MATLYGVGLSPYVRKVRVLLAEKGLAYEHDPVIPFNASAEFKQMSPLGKIPVYRDDKVVLPDSSVICSYLERTNPTPPLYPSDPVEQARALWFEEYGDSALAQNLGGGLFFQKIVAPRFLQRPTDEAVVDKALTQDIPPLFDYLESQLQAREVIAGTRFSIGDIGICTHFVNMQHAGYDVDATRWPKLARYKAHILARPSFKALIDEETPLFRAAS
jgi:glutathione S-transferase